MITLENKRKIQDIVNMVSNSRCESYWETTLLRSTVGLTDVEVLGCVLNMEIEFNFRTPACLDNIYQIRMVGDLYRLFNIHFIKKVKYKENIQIGY